MIEKRLTLEELFGRDIVSQEEVAETMELSRSQVNTAEKMAFKKIRAYLWKNNYNKEDLL
jgi:DNA-directed RNA polymerase specialized sigma subunit